MKETKDYVVDTGTYVTMQLLHCVYYTYHLSYPKHIKKEVKKLLETLIDEVDKEHKEETRDIIDSELIERLTYKEKEQKNPLNI